jgi:DNA polymerase-1
MRLAACYAGNKELLETFQNEGDVHQQVADRLHIKRQTAKTINFAIIYGAGINKIAQQLGIKRTYAETILENYKAAYPEIFYQINVATETAAIQKWVRMWTGRRRHFKYPSEEHKAFNAVIQGGGFEIVKRSMLILDRAGYDIRNCVHDSVWIQMKKPSESDLKEIESLMSDWTAEEFDVRFSVDSKKLN